MTLLSHALAEPDPSLEPPPMPETDPARQTTHWVGCEQVHHACALALLDRLRQDARRFYRGDGSSGLLDSAEDVVRRRVEAAGEIVRLRAERDALLALCVDPCRSCPGRWWAFLGVGDDGEVWSEHESIEQAQDAVRAAAGLAPSAPEPPR